MEETSSVLPKSSPVPKPSIKPAVIKTTTEPAVFKTTTEPSHSASSDQDDQEVSDKILTLSTSGTLYFPRLHNWKCPRHTGNIFPSKNIKKGYHCLENENEKILIFVIMDFCLV